MDPETPALFALLVGLVFGIPLVFGLAMWGMVKLAQSSVARSRPYRLALEVVRVSPEAQRTLGTPIADSPPLSANLSYGLLGGRASFDIPLAGPGGTANLYVKARRFWGPWRFSRLTLGVHRGGEIDLLTEQRSAV